MIDDEPYIRARRKRVIRHEPQNDAVNLGLDKVAISFEHHMTDRRVQAIRANTDMLRPNGEHCLIPFRQSLHCRALHDTGGRIDRSRSGAPAGIDDFAWNECRGADEVSNESVGRTGIDCQRRSPLNDAPLFMTTTMSESAKASS